jgi:hypothetical protein
MYLKVDLPAGLHAVKVGVADTIRGRAFLAGGTAAGALSVEARVLANVDAIVVICCSTVR